MESSLQEHKSPSLKFEKGLLVQADGSAKFSMNNTSVICSAYGPIEAKPQEEILDKACIEVTFAPDVGLIETKEKLIEYNLKSTLESLILTTMNPRTKYKFMFQVLDNDGLIEATAFNSLSVALIDAGIPIFQIITASSCCIMDDNSIVLCPTNKQKTIAKSFHTFVFSRNESDSPVYINSLGTFDLSE
ncbi:hypothetical protein BB560_006402, partial [Smittium megazygosporum]